MNVRRAAVLGLLVCGATQAIAQDTAPVSIAGTFRIDRTEVTIAAFEEFLRTTGRKTVAEAEGGGHEFGAGWERRPGWTVARPFGAPPQSDMEPAVHVSWQEAVDFCIDRGGRLPTAAEWAEAAYTERRLYPESPFQTGVTYPYPSGETASGMNNTGDDAWPRHAPVSSTPAGVNGLYDMGGNVWEWLADRRGDDALTAGGSWWYGPDKATRSAMQWKPAKFFAVYVGFRCAYSAG